MGIIGPVGGITAAMKKGYKDGFVAKYSSTTATAITSGYYEANGKLYSLAADTTHAMTSLAAGFGRHYIYIDDSASSPPTPTFIDSTTPPTWNHAKRGWYNGDDRCVGFCYSPAGSAVILPFGTAILSDRKIRMFFSLAATAQFNIALNMWPDSSWQTPNIQELSVILPPNAQEAYIWMTNTDVGSLVTLAAVQSELATGTFSSGHLYGDCSEQSSEQRWIPLGASQNIKLNGAAGDDNALTAYLNGIGYSR